MQKREGNITSYRGLVDRLKALAQEAERHATPFNPDAMGEAIDLLKDLDRLECRVRTTMSGLSMHDEEQAVRTIALLKEHSATDPKLAEYFANNPNPQLMEISFFGATADSDALTSNEHRRQQLQDLRIDAHAWYYFAHRLLKVIAQIPELKSFKCRQVIIVRNHLLEHPEGETSGVTQASHGYDQQRGPIVKALRINDQVGRHTDDGLYAASESLRASFLRVLQTAETCFAAVG